MYYAYVLKSIDHDYIYKRHCQDIEKRIRQHNAGMTISIRPYLPFELIYVEEFETENEAIARKKYFKTSAGRRFLKARLAS
ncbi:MAG: GIY-YIG nuclease family protein [Ferruginibacter sp.]|nr:GIY-YIG nuclease family protein [Ferruginibacter sp.]